MKINASNFPLPIGQLTLQKQRLALTAIILLATGLYLYGLGAESLWLDEIFSMRDASQPVLQIFESNRPLYYFLLSLWMRMGRDEAWLRGLSVLFSLGSIVLTYRLGCRLFNGATGLVAALLLTLSPLAINHAQEVRMYMLGVFLGLAGTLALVLALERPTPIRVRSWAGLRLLSMLTAPLNFTLLIPDILLLGLRFRHQQRSLWRFGRWLLVIGVLWLPFFLRSADAASEFSTGWVVELLPPPSLLTVIGTLVKFTSGTVTPPLDFDFWIYKRFFDLYALLLVGVLGIAFWLRQRSENFLWVAAWAFLPLAALFAVCYIYSSIWLDRYLLFTAPYVFILLAAGFTKLWNWQRGIALLVVLTYSIAVSGELAEYYISQSRQDWRGLAETISVNDRPGDLIAVPIESRRLAVAYYYQGSAPIQVMASPSQDQPLSQELTVEQSLRSLPDASRFWFVLSGVGNKEQQRNFKSAIAQRYQIQLDRTFFDGIDLLLATPRTEGRQAIAPEDKR